MKQLLYEDSAHLLTLDYPQEWDVSTVTGVDVSIADTAGNALLAATAATVCAGSLAAAASAKAGTITVDTVTGTITNGKRYRLHEKTAADAEAIEDVVVSYHTVSGSTYTLYLEEELKNDHSDNTDILGCFCTYSADLSDTDDFPKGKQLVITWTPTGDNLPYTERAEIAGVAAGLPNLWHKLSVVYPIEWGHIRGRSSDELSELEGIYRSMFDSEFAARGVDVNRIVGQDVVLAGMLLYVRKMILTGQGDMEEHELEVARGEWVNWFKGITEQAELWQDTDQDGVKDDTEEEIHGFEVFQRYL